MNISNHFHKLVFVVAVLRKYVFVTSLETFTVFQLYVDNLTSLTYWHARIKFSKLFRLKILNLLYVRFYLTKSFESTLKIIFQFEFFIWTLNFKLINERKKSNRRNDYKIYKIRRKLYSVHKKHPSYIVFPLLGILLAGHGELDVQSVRLLLDERAVPRVLQDGHVISVHALLWPRKVK